MPRPIHICVTVEPDGRWRFSVGDGATRPAEGWLAAAEASALPAAVEARLATRARVMIPGEDSARARAEAEVGSLLLRAIPSDGAGGGPCGRLRELLGVAAGQGGPALLVVDAADEVVRALPWELLVGEAGEPPLEATETAVLARLSPGRARLRPAQSPTTHAALLTVRVWCPTPADPTCARLRALLDGLASRLALTVVDLDPTTPAAGTDEIDGPEVLVIIGHGRRDLDTVGLRLAEGDHAPDAATARLGSLVCRAELVHLGVCAGAEATPRELDSLAARLVASGARSVVAPWHRAGVEALEHLTAGLLDALCRSETPADAVRAGRRAVRAWGHPHPISRWANTAWLVSDLDAVQAPPLVPAGWQPPGWPRPAPEAGALLLAAQRWARAQGDGFVGFEHLLRAITGVPGGGLLSAWLRRAAPGRLVRFETRLGQLTLQDPAAPEVLSARLCDLGARLAPGFDLESLFSLLCDEPDLARALLGEVPAPTTGDDPFATIDSAPSASSGPATALRVLGGPEDGRWLLPRSGQSIGRSSDGGGPDIALYQGTRLTDRKLSRLHLLWLEPGRVELRRAAVRGRGGGERAMPVGPCELRVGDLLALTPATHLVGVDAPKQSCCM